MVSVRWFAAVWIGVIGASTAHGEEVKPKDYEIVAGIEPQTLHVGDKGKLSLVIKPKAPWQLKPSTPFTATLSATAGVALEKSTLTGKDFVDPKAADKTLVAPFAMTAGGGQSIATAINFFICTEQVCVRYKEAIETKLNVK